MVLSAPENEPELKASGDLAGRRLQLSGDWTAGNASLLEELVAGVTTNIGSGQVSLDLSQLGRLDTIGAVVLDRLRRAVSEFGGSVVLEGGQPEQRTLIETVARDLCTAEKPKYKSGSFTLLEDIGKGVVGAGQDLAAWVMFLGEITAGVGRILLQPARMRFTPFVHHLELVGLRAVPIIALISFLVGAIVAQQSIFQLRSFGATIFVVDLIGILTLRELGVLLTAIMLAGRSGSAFTAEIGSMKMREEIDALRVMGLDIVEVLVLPRLMALVVAATLLTVIAEFSSMAGGAMVASIYGGISLDVFLTRLSQSLTIESYLVGILKAPSMGIVIGLIATIEGMRVEGSAESLGLRTTASVVKAIFMVIVLDGLFAMFFAAVGL